MIVTQKLVGWYFLYWVGIFLLFCGGFFVCVLGFFCLVVFKSWVDEFASIKILLEDLVHLLKIQIFPKLPIAPHYCSTYNGFFSHLDSC